MYIKKLLFILMLISVSAGCAALVYAEDEVQLTDYVFAYGRRMLDGYSYADHAHYDGYSEYTGHSDSIVRTWYLNVYGSNILRPDGTFLYNTDDFAVDYRITKPDTENISEGYSFPQHKSGKTFSIYKTDKNEFTHKYLIMDENGKIQNDLWDSRYYPIRDGLLYYFFYSDNAYFNERCGIWDQKTGKRFAKDAQEIYYNEGKDEVAALYRDKDKYFYSPEIVFYKNGEEYDRYDISNPAYKYSSGSVPIGYEEEDLEVESGKYIEYKGVRYDFIPTNNYIYTDYQDDGYSNMDLKSEESKSDRVDKSYYFKPKEINGETYYALFKKLNDGESAENYKLKYAAYENVNKMLDEGLLFNNEACFLDEGISKTEFCIVAARAVCMADNYDITKYKHKTRFCDINLPYCTLLADMGIIDAQGPNFIQDEKMSGKQAYAALYRIAELGGVEEEWRKSTNLWIWSGQCAKSEVYDAIYELYKLLCETDKKIVDADVSKEDTTEPVTEKEEKKFYIKIGNEKYSFEPKKDIFERSIRLSIKTAMPVIGLLMLFEYVVLRIVLSRMTGKNDKQEKGS